MAISGEFAEAVSDKNLLRIRIMLKDSLLVDRSFRSFDEMQSYALKNNASPWIETDIPLEKADKPWTEDTMNYELAALVNDFTKEHVNYVKAIITDIYKSSSISSVPPANRNTAPAPPQPIIEKSPASNSLRSKGDPYTTISSKVEEIDKILRRNKGEKRRWYSKDVRAIKSRAQAIVDVCSEIQRRG